MPSRRTIRLHLLPALLAALCCSGALLAADKSKPVQAVKGERFQKPEPTRFLRVLRNAKKQPKSLETAIVKYVPANGKKTLEVALIGAVHVGDKAYYQKLNTAFETYDVVLYELVAPRGTRIKKNERNNSTFARIIKNVLELDSQIQQIDYTKKNFVHADLSFAEMAKAMKKRGHTGFSLFASVFADMMKQQNKRMQAANKGGKPLPEISLATLLFDPNRAIKLKRIMAEEFAGANAAAGLGGTLNSLLIDDRNKACIKVLDAQVKRGKKRIAIFYGAAHMPDFETRLLKEFGLKRTSVEWVQAWDLTK
ncbi:MAG: hypothetical protein ACE5KM_23460 [Planctomycetaceae bacterium]